MIRQLVGLHVSSFEYFMNLGKLLKPVKKQFLSDIEQACTGMDAILYSLLGTAAWHVAECFSIPLSTWRRDSDPISFQPIALSKAT